jgi:hypothetical protein
MMDAQELLRERQQYQSIQETTKKVSLNQINNFIVTHSRTQSKDPQEGRQEQSLHYFWRHWVWQDHLGA